MNLRFAARGLARQPGRTALGIAGIAATGALLFNMLMLSRGLVVSMERLLEANGFDIRVTESGSLPPAGRRIPDAASLVATIASLPEVEEVVPVRIEDADLEIGRRSMRVTLIGASVKGRRPWTLMSGQDLTADESGEQAAGSLTPRLLVNRATWEMLRVPVGEPVTVRGVCAVGSSAPPVVFRLAGIADFPFDQASARTIATTLRDLERTCGDAGRGEADVLLIASRAEHGADHAARAIRRVRSDVQTTTNDELVARFERIEFSYFRQISVVLASITLFFGMLLITVLLSVSTNQRLGEIAALRALGFSHRRMASDVLWRSSLLVGTGGLLAIPLALALSSWLDSLLLRMPGIPATVSFFVLEARALAAYGLLLAVTTMVAAAYPIRIIVRLPIAGTLRNEVVG
jgi:ABC-type lipoprotein release transport system permease subunit